MSVNLTVEAPAFDEIKRETGENTKAGFITLWQVANADAKTARTGIRLAIERQEVKTLIFTLAANQNNFDTAFSSTLRSDGAVAVSITGIKARVEGARIRVLVLGTGTITLSHNSGSSEATNRLLFFAGVDKVVATNRAVDLEYQSARWREISYP